MKTFLKNLYTLVKLTVVLFFIMLILLGLRMCFWKPDVCGSRELWRKGVETTSRQIDGAMYPGSRLHGEHTIYDGYLTYNKTQVLDCDDETDLSVVRRYLYIEYRDPELHKDLKDVLKRETQSPELSTLFHAAGFRFLPLNFEYQCPLSGELDKAKLLGDCQGIREKFLAWDPKFVLKHAPSWLPQEQLKAETFIAFFGEGSLFQGKESNQYFWVSF